MVQILLWQTEVLTYINELLVDVILTFPLTVKGGQLSKSNIIKTQKITSLCIHMECAIGHIRQYCVLGDVIPLSIAPFADCICFLLCPQYVSPPFSYGY